MSALDPSASTSTLVEISSKKRKAARQEVRDESDAISADTLDALNYQASKKRTITAADRSNYPPEAKKVYLDTKKLLTKKVATAANIKATNAKLEEGAFPNFIGFKCLPHGAQGDLDYISNWNAIVMRCKRELTLLYVDHLRSNYRDIKNSIDLNMLALENTLDEDQFQEVFDYLKAGYKLAGPKAVTKAKHPFKANTQGSRVFKKG
jgi:hypothetical protein